MSEDDSKTNNRPPGLENKISFLKKMLDLNPNPLFINDLINQKIQFVNRRVKELFDLNQDFITNQGLDIYKTILHPDDYQLRKDNLKKCEQLQTLEECEAEVRFKVKNIGWQWFKINDKVFERNEEGSVTHIISTAQNIHQQKLWEEKQKEDQRRFKNAQEIGHIGSFERNLPGDLFYYSPEFYRILGIEPKDEEISLEEFISHVHPEDREAYQQAIKHTHTTGEPLDMVTRAVRPDGSLRYIHRRAALIKDDTGKPIRVYGTAQDITGRIETEEEKKRLDGLMEATEVVAGTGSYEADLRTGKVYFSRGLFRLFGYEPGEFDPSLEWINDQSHPDDVPIVQQILDEATANKSDYTYTRRIFRRDGQLRIVESQGKIILDEQENPAKFIGLVQDVTERKKAEEELRSSEERTRNLLTVLQNAPDSYLVLTPDFNIEMVSDAYLEATKTKREEITGKYLFDIFPDNPALPNATGEKNLRASLNKVLTSGKPHRMAIQHYDVRDPNGDFEEKHWSPTNSPVLNSSGEVEYIIHRVLDITNVFKEMIAIKGLVNETEILKTSLEEIKLQAAQIEEGRMLLQSIFDASPNSIILFDILYDKEGKVEDFQYAMLNAFNFENLGISQDLVGKRLIREFPKVKETGILEQLQRTAETGIPADFESNYEGDGLNHYFRFRAKKLKDQLVLTSEDITGRKKSEETIQQMLNGSISAITILDSIRDKQGKIIDFRLKGGNKAAERLNGISTEELVGKSLLELFPGIRHTFLDLYINVVENGESLRTQQYYNHEHFDNWFDVSAIKNGDGIILTYLDITEQKKAEQELLKLKEQLAKKATDKYRKIINSMDEGYCLLELIYDDKGKCIDYRFLETNPVFEQQSGMNNVIGRTIKEIVPGIESYWFEYYNKVAKTGESIRIDDYVESLGRWFDEYAFKIDSLEENHVAVIFKDITERKEAEDRQTFLLQLNDALRPLADPEEIQYTAMQHLGKHLEVNRAYYAEAMEDEDTFLAKKGYLSGVAAAPYESKMSDFDKGVRDQFIKGQTLVINNIYEDLEITEEKNTIIETHRVQAAIGVPLVKNKKLLAVVGVHSTSARRWTTAEVSLVEEVSENIWAAVERARAEAGLRESEQKFRDLVESSALAVWETNTEGKVVSDSPSWRAFTGQSFDEWKGEGWANAVHPDDRSSIIEDWNKAVSTQSKLDYELRLKSKNGEIRWTNIKAVPLINLEGQVTKWVGMHLDIHEMKMTQQALLDAKEQAEAASMAKEDFVSTMSHEIRTPLNAVIGLTNLLLEKDPREDQRKNLDSLNFSAQNLLSLINDILDFSKLEAGKGEIEDNVFDLYGLILSLQHLYEPQAQNNGSRLKLHLDPNLPKHIVTDQLKLSQILHNLISNAVKFTKNGSIDFTIEISEEQEDKLWLDFEVQDTGIGVPQEKLVSIFEKFSQAESSTVRQYGGTGLGLTITKLLLELFGSEIKVESKIGKGSRFYFSLPVKKVEVEMPVAIPSKELQEENVVLNDMNILLVEDVEVNRDILHQFFENWWQIQPDEAHNGLEAVNMARNKKYDMLLMDVRMPVMDGNEATKLIRQIPGYENTPILALTADKNQEVLQAQDSTQFNDLLTKPFDPAQLKIKILHHLKSNQFNEKNTPVLNSEEKRAPGSNNINKAAGNQEVHLPYSVEKYQSLAGENREILEKLINNSIKAVKTYRQEFINAANNHDEEAISNLIHKNTITLHYIEAKDLGNLIFEYREDLKSSQEATLSKQKVKDIIAEFDTVVTGLEEYLMNR